MVDKDVLARDPGSVGVALMVVRDDGGIERVIGGGSLAKGEPFLGIVGAAGVRASPGAGACLAELFDTTFYACDAFDLGEETLEGLLSCNVDVLVGIREEFEEAAKEGRQVRDQL